MLPSMGDLKFLNLNYDHSCTYMNKKYARNADSSKYLAELKTYCNKIKPFVSHYSKLIKSYNANFYFYFNKTAVTPIVLDGGDEIILANWPNDKLIICNINNNIPVKIPSHPYVLVNRSILCNCGIEADSHHLHESLAACDNKPTELTMHFTINLAFSNYLELMPNITDQTTLNRCKTNFEQPLPIFLHILHFDNSLSNRPGKLKDFCMRLHAKHK